VVYGLVLQGSPDFQHGFSLNGAAIDGEIELRQFSNLKAFITPEGLPVFQPGLAELRSVSSVTALDRSAARRRPREATRRAGPERGRRPDDQRRTASISSRCTRR
jgi:hypothetical protein